MTDVENIKRYDLQSKPMKTDATSHNVVSPTVLGVLGTCWHVLRGACKRSQNNRNVRSRYAKSLTGFKLYATSANKCQHCCGSMQTDNNNNYYLVAAIQTKFLSEPFLFFQFELH